MPTQIDWPGLSEKVQLALGPGRRVLGGVWPMGKTLRQGRVWPDPELKGGCAWRITVKMERQAKAKYWRHGWHIKEFGFYPRCNSNLWKILNRGVTQS